MGVQVPAVVVGEMGHGLKVSPFAEREIRRMDCGTTYGQVNAPVIAKLTTDPDCREASRRFIDPAKLTQTLSLENQGASEKVCLRRRTREAGNQKPLA